jgi:site-specific DNA-methyltransferase (adenine-specific)
MIWSENPHIEIINGDCVEGMKAFKENEFDLAIVDPPYGIGEDGGKFRGRKNDNYKRIVIHQKKNWDKKPPHEYFVCLQHISNNQIISGANYFVNYLKPVMGWVFWDKLIGGDFSDGEFIYTSFNKAGRKYTYSYHGDTKGGHTRIHPTQKPVALYKWLLKNYAKEGDKILDTHLGSGSIAIACYDMGFDLIGFEIDKDYYDAALKRFNQHKIQLKIF